MNICHIMIIKIPGLPFKTVWQTDAFSYCLCKCGIDHEYVEYAISGTREIRENVFEKVVDCITKERPLWPSG